MERKSGMKIEEEKSTSFFICVLLSELVRNRSGRNVDWLRCHRRCYPPLLNEFNIWFSLLFLALNSLQCHLAAASLSIHLVLSPLSLAETRYWRTGFSYKWCAQLFSFIYFFFCILRRRNFSRASLWQQVKDKYLRVLLKYIHCMLRLTFSTTSK